MSVIGDRDDLTVVLQAFVLEVASLRIRTSDHVGGEAERTFPGDRTGPLPQVPHTRDRGITSSGTVLAEGRKHKSLCNQADCQELQEPSILHRRLLE